jgi:hypothetical protein
MLQLYPSDDGDDDDDAIATAAPFQDGWVRMLGISESLLDNNNNSKKSIIIVIGFQSLSDSHGVVVNDERFHGAGGNRGKKNRRGRSRRQ